ncbi:MAG: lysostaphin resistance A-like protein [Chthoniobacterales bacterium]
MARARWDHAKSKACEVLQARKSPENPLARSLRGFGPLGVAAIVVILTGDFLFTPFSAILVLVWAWCSRTPWRDLGFVRPASWISTVALGIAFGCAFKLLMKAVVMPLLGAPAINQAFHYLAGNTAALPEILFAVIVGAGFGEEILFRGYLFERFGKLFGSSVWGRTLTVLITAAWFGSEHYAVQGVPGVRQATIFGLVFGSIFAVTRRIWLLIVAHAAFDLTAVAIIYCDVESNVAHLIFR